MPRYFFNTHLHDAVVPDPEGTELPDPDAAWEAARATIRAALRDPRARPELASACLVVTGADGEVVLEFPFAEVLAEPLDEKRDDMLH